MMKMFTNDAVSEKWWGIVEKFSLQVGARAEELSDANTLLGIERCERLRKALEETDNVVFGDAAGMASNFIGSHRLDAAPISMKGLQGVLSDFEKLVRARAQKLRLVLGPVEVIDEFSSELDKREQSVAVSHPCRLMLAELKQLFIQIIDEQIPYALHASHAEVRVAPAERVADASVTADLALIPVFPCSGDGREHELIARVRRVFDDYMDSIFQNSGGMVSFARGGSDDALMHMESEVLDCLGKMRTLSREAEHLFDEIVENIERSTHLFLREEKKELRDYIASLKQLREELTCAAGEVKDLFRHISAKLQSVRGKGCSCWSLFSPCGDVPVAQMYKSVLAEVEKGLLHALPDYGGSVHRAVTDGKRLAETMPNEGGDKGVVPGTRV